MAFQCFNLCVSHIYVSHIYVSLEVYIDGISMFQSVSLSYLCLSFPCLSPDGC